MAEYLSEAWFGEVQVVLSPAAAPGAGDPTLVVSHAVRTSDGAERPCRGREIDRPEVRRDRGRTRSPVLVGADHPVALVVEDHDHGAQAGADRPRPPPCPPTHLSGPPPRGAIAGARP